MSGAGQGARKRSENRQKQGRLTVRLSPAERQEVETLADRAGLTLASYLRSRALEKPTTRAVRRPTVEVEVMNALLREMSKQGSNLNQLAKKANAGNMPLLSEIRATFEANRQTAKLIWDRLKGNT
jgi:Bacterial mobilisation protein (MobC).